VQEQIFKINQAIYQQAGLPPQFAQETDSALKELGQDVGRLGSLVDGVRLETGRKEAEYQRIQATAGMQAVEIERLRSEVETLQMRLSAAEKNNEEVQNTYQKVIQSMEQQKTQILEELQVCVAQPCRPLGYSAKRRNWTWTKDSCYLLSCAKSNSRASRICSTPPVRMSRPRPRFWA
jgi:hypothetical protein